MLHASCSHAALKPESLIDTKIEVLLQLATYMPQAGFPRRHQNLKFAAILRLACGSMYVWFMYGTCILPGFQANPSIPPTRPAFA